MENFDKETELLRLYNEENTDDLEKVYNKKYNDILDEIISRLIVEKDKLSENIFEIATYLDTLEYDVALTKTDIKDINNIRYKMKQIYEIISDLDKLKKEV